MKESRLSKKESWNKLHGVVGLEESDSPADLEAFEFIRLFAEPVILPF
jgi:hypothetical protein